MKKISLINLKIRNKLLLIYFFCVLIPIILTDAVILFTVKGNYETERQKETEYLMERIDMNLSETIMDCILFTNNLYMDRLLNEFLEEQYTSYIDYYDQYSKLLRYNNLSYNYNNSVLTKIQIYTDNETMLPGGKIADLNAARDTDWFVEYENNDKPIMLYAYYDDTKRYAMGSGTSRTVSIIRALDNYGDKGIEKVLKIDINYNVLLNCILNEKTDADIYVRNADYILFSNQAGDSNMKEYPSATSITVGKNTQTRQFVVGRQEWEIVVEPGDTDFWAIVLGNPGLLSLVLMNIALPSLLILFVGKSISKRLSIIASHMDKVKKEEFEEIQNVSGEDEIGALMHSYNLMIRKIRNLIQVVFKDQTEKQALEISRKQAELKAIQSQVNPHFLFNTLESIRMRSLIKGEEETADIIGEMAVILRKSMIWGSDFVTIEEELSFIEKYIHIQKYRFGDKIKYYCYVMDECRQYIIPKLTIGTFVENACVHGIESSTEAGLISLNISKNEAYLIIEISDNGKGVEKDKLDELKRMLPNANSEMLNESKSTGMLNAFLRLKMYCEGEAIFTIDSTPENGTSIVIQLPLSRLDLALKKNADSKEQHRNEVQE